jgi:hypothetical protein
MVPLDEFPDLLRRLSALRAAVEKIGGEGRGEGSGIGD